MKEVMLKISSFFMALLVLFSTMSFSVDKHYCGDTLVDSSIFFEAEGCGMELQTNNDLKDCSVKKKNCCSDVTIIFQGQEDLKTSFDKIDLQKQQFIASFYFTYVNLFEGLEENIIPFYGYPPPLLITDIQLLDETFLI